MFSNDKVMQFIRTAVQSVLSYLLLQLAAWPVLAEVGLSISDEVENFLTALLMAVYVLAIRTLSERFPVIGYLNGPPVEPTYSSSELPA